MLNTVKTFCFARFKETMPGVQSMRYTNNSTVRGIVSMIWLRRLFVFPGNLRSGKLEREASNRKPFPASQERFFYAGTRALLVAHWPVNSDAAVGITTGATGAIPASVPPRRSAARSRPSQPGAASKRIPVSGRPLCWSETAARSAPKRDGNPRRNPMRASRLRWTPLTPSSGNTT
jgi:hypothetical protein